MTRADATHDYVVIGSGAGGGTVAARLVESGYRVLVIEAGADPLSHDMPASVRAHYEVPAFHAAASEDPAFDWPFFVQHFDDPATSAADPNRTEDGIFYPRAAALGGCTAHNAMIFLPPPDDDWDELARASGDEGWGAAAMRLHRKQVENCRHRWLLRLAARLGLDRSGHGWRGWLPVEKAMPLQAFGDFRLMRAMAKIAIASASRDRNWLQRLLLFFGNAGDPNCAASGGKETAGYLPLATRRHRRFGTRERLRDVQRRHPGKLDILTSTLVTTIRFEGDRAVGVDWLSGDRLPCGLGEPAGGGTSFAAREIVLSGGAFATPQLLQLSGIGDPELLRPLGIDIRAALPAVGRNLQDRYEFGVVHRMAKPWRSLRGANFSTRDPLYRRWRWLRRGMYSSNGSAFVALRRSRSARLGSPDVVLMGMLGRFSGYRSGYSNETWAGLDGFTWTVLKGQTGNRAGSVSIVSRDPRHAPAIHFRNFEEQGEADLAGLLEGIAMARDLATPLIECGLIAGEEWPGRQLDETALHDLVRAGAWGHHACGTAAIGPVLDGQGRVKGVRGLRVADASIFPRIPGLFIAAPILMAAEKIAADIVADARLSPAGSA